MFASKDVFLKSSGGYTIARSVRFRSSASAYLNRTPSVASNRRTFTWSGWVKLGILTASNTIFSTGANNTAGTFFGIQIYNTGKINIGNGVTDLLRTTPLYRDPSAWYHVVVAVDTTNATADNRVRLYINGVEVTAFDTRNNPTQNTDLGVNNTIVHYHGTSQYSGTRAEFFDGYITEVNLIDGLQLTPSSFGATDAITGVWQPKKYSGTYGTNGFYLKFADNSTAAALGTDSSGNSNTWTVNNISVTAGATYDSMLDVPTLTSATVANYCVLNPLAIGFSGITISDANLTYAGSSSSGSLRGSLGVSSGLWYFEVNNLTWNSSQQSNFFGIAKDTVANSVDPGNSVDSYAIYFGGSAASTLYKVNNSTNTSVTTTPTSPFTGMVAVNLNTNKVWFGANGTWFGSGDPAAGTNAAFTIANAGTYTSVSKPSGGSTSSTGSINFGQRPFSYTPPTGFVALNTYNLSTPTIANGAAYMAATTYTGTGSSLTVANTVNGVSFQPDFVWIKGRSGATDHALYDVVRGTTKDLVSNSSAAETTQATGLTAFGSTGFTVGALAKLNTSAATYVGWQWKANGTGVSNTSGSITSTVSANTTAGFSVATYTGTGANATVGHGLGVAPSMIIVKARSSVQDWAVYHISLGNTGCLQLNTTSAFITSSTLWNNTTPTSSVFTVANSGATNGSATTYVAYCFAAVAGYSAFGSYTGNGSTDGPFVYTNMRPRWVLIKRATDANQGWQLYDNARNPYNTETNLLFPDGSNAEQTGNAVDVLSNGFKLRSSDTPTNSSGIVYVYAAFAENPFKYSLAR